MESVSKKAMRYSEKLPGKTLAESLGIDFPDDAPGGRAVAPLAGGSGKVSQRTNPGAREAVAQDYDGFTDVDGYGRADT